jgi:hypothetical protein
MSKIIKFTHIYGLDSLFPPEPASRNVPEWYKDLESYLGGEKIPPYNKQQDYETTGTIKRCMPVFDAINSGYIIKSPADVYISQRKIEHIDEDHFKKTGESIQLSEEYIEKHNYIKTQPYYQWASQDLIQFHPVEQAPNHPNRGSHTASYPKWNNPWGITTPPGYSVLFVQPLHRESVFTILPGVVDTDKYNTAVNFPFVLNDINFEGFIPAGTPIAQVIPFKRDSWNMEMGTEKDVISINKQLPILRSVFFDSYKRFFRQKKDYR